MRINQNDSDLICVDGKKNTAINTKQSSNHNNHS